MAQIPFLRQYKGLRKEIYVLFFGRMVTSLGAMVWPMLTLILTQKLHVSAGKAAVLIVVGALLGVPANAWGGILADRMSKKKIIILFDIVSVVCFLLCGLMPLSSVSIVLMIIAALAQSMENPGYNALLADLSSTQRRDDAYSLLYLGGNLGMVLSPTLAGILFRNYLWLSFLIQGIGIGCSTILIALFVKDITPVREESTAASYQKKQDDLKFSQVLRQNRTAVLFLLTVGLYGAAYQQISYLVPLELSRIHGDSGALLYGTMNSLNCIVVVLFTPVFNHLLARTMDVRRSLYGDIMQFAGYLLLMLSLGHIPLYYLAMTLFTWGEILSATSTSPYLSRRIPSSHRGRMEGFQAVVNLTAGSAGQLLTGFLLDAYGPSAAWTAVLLMAGGAILLGSVILPADHRTYRSLYENG